jgi:hypothetical protein
MFGGGKTMKDPLQNDEYPYEILNIPSNASKREIQQALVEYLRAGKNPSLGMKARQVLLGNAQSRLENDLFSYSFDDISRDTIPSESIINIQNYSLEPEPAIHDLFWDLNKENYSDDFGQISYNNVNIQKLESYDAHPESDLDEEFDI